MVEITMTGAPARARFSTGAQTLLFAVGAALLTFVMYRAQLTAVWRTGAFFDTDDAMRLAQVRALLAGQGWFDMTAYRMDAPHGVVLHWSRIVDLPIVALIELLARFTDFATAERLARLAFPFGLLVGLYLAMGRLAALLLGAEARLPAIGATLLSGVGICQFVPGRIDHHAPQILILVLMLGAVVAAFDPRRSRQACIAGALAGLSLAISLENLPFVAGVAALLVAVWVGRGRAMAPMLAWYALGLAIGLPLFFIATVAPSLYFTPVCDAFGMAHLGAGLIGAMGCACLATLSLMPCRRSSLVLRFAAAGLVALAAAAFVALAYPACLKGPFAGVDPLVREIWISRVEESLPLATQVARDPVLALYGALPVALGLCGLAAALLRTSGIARLRFVCLALVSAIGLAMAFWQVRVLSSVSAIALVGGLWLAMSVRRAMLARGHEALASLSLCLVLPFTATGVSLLLPAEAAAPTGGPSLAACLAPSAFAPLASLPPGRVVAPVDAGSYLIVHTALSPFAAAYHRNNDGNRFALDLMSAPAADAGGMAMRRHVGWVMTCAGLSETSVLAARGPGLAADLQAGRVPTWLTPVVLPGTPWRLYAVRNPPRP